VNYAFSKDVDDLNPGESGATTLVTPKEKIEVVLTCDAPYEYRISVDSQKANLAAAWLRDLSDGYISFDDDLQRKLPGPVLVDVVEDNTQKAPKIKTLSADKPYYIGIQDGNGKALPKFKWQESESKIRRTPLFETHKKLGAKLIPFAGWEMPVWYSSVLEEHQAVREGAGIFDVAHMGVYQVEGIDATVFLDSVVGNDISALGVGESCYTHFLDPDANVIDDLLVYHRDHEKYLVVVNAANDDKDWTWLNKVKNGEVMVSRQRPWAKAFGKNVRLRNLRDPKEDADMRVDIALQGPRSRDILLALGVDDETRKRITTLKRTQLCDAEVGGFDLVVSRTGYTGEKMAFELFVHPEKADQLFNTLLKVGQEFGIKPIGLGARDSLRTEAGLPLYGHEMGVASGKMEHPDLGVAEAGFGSYVKTYKPWFIGREAYIEKNTKRKGVVVRFRFNEKGIRMAHPGDPVMDKRGKVTGWVTSCAIDLDGYFTGQAFVDLKNTLVDNTLMIYQGATEKELAPSAKLSLGSRTVLPAAATIIDRFPK